MLLWALLGSGQDRSPARWLASNIATDDRRHLRRRWRATVFSRWVRRPIPQTTRPLPAASAPSPPICLAPEPGRVFRAWQEPPAPGLRNTRCPDSWDTYRRLHTCSSAPCRRPLSSLASSSCAPCRTSAERGTYSSRRRRGRRSCRSSRSRRLGQRPPLQRSGRRNCRSPCRIPGSSQATGRRSPRTLPPKRSS